MKAGNSGLRSVLTVTATAALVVVSVVLVGGALDLATDDPPAQGHEVQLASASTGLPSLHSDGRASATTASTVVHSNSSTTLSPTPAVQLGIAGIDTTIGVRVTECTVGGAAAAAGLRTGDMIVVVDHDPVDRMSEVKAALADVRPGKHVSVTVRRDGKQLTIDVAVGQAS